jgi:hypothetical protein
MTKRVFTSNDYLGRNTVTGLRTPAEDLDAFRLVDWRAGSVAINNAIAAGDQQLQQNLTAGDQALQNNLNAAVAQLEAAYQAADQAEIQARRADIQSIVSGFTPKDPVYAVINGPVALSGLNVTSPSFTGAIPARLDGAPTRVLVIAQGGDQFTPHAANGIYTVADGAWTRATDFDEDTEVRRSILVPVEGNGIDGFANTIFFLREPEIFQNVDVGTTPLRFARWLGTEMLHADEVTIHREGNTFSVRLNPNQLQAGPDGVQLTPTYESSLLSLPNATGLLGLNQINGLDAHVTSFPLNQFAVPIAPVLFNDQKLTALADPTVDTDAVNLRSLEAAIAQATAVLNQQIAAILARDFSTPLSGGREVDGDTIYDVTHNLNSSLIMEKVFDTVNGQTVDTEFVRVTTDANTCQVIFSNQVGIPASRYVLMLHKVG